MWNIKDWEKNNLYWYGTVIFFLILTKETNFFPLLLYSLFLDTSY